MKTGANSGHQNHNDLDAGDFVIDAMGIRWAGELGSGDYLAPGYFVGDKQDDQRWMYYRTMTEGQNTLLINKKPARLWPTQDHQARKGWCKAVAWYDCLRPSFGTSTLSLDGKELKVVLRLPSSVTWTQSEAKRMNGNVTPPAPDQENPGVTVLIAEVPQGVQTVEVVFNPSWGDDLELRNPPSVSLDSWGLETHD
ncbi:heparinase ii iii family protein [Moniliophthora roreri MCA 2997]|uniref:Heparinase ii iii family protein n=2 Tax=Moniliophthora roreri TaxID=221103 RepID=V2YK06_MONRO|nr:heparinase ii iii family protein [Moniliophthora roreri MCA 2997]